MWRKPTTKETTKKGDTRIRKPPDALLSDSYSEPKLTYSSVDAVPPNGATGHPQLISALRVYNDGGPIK